MADWRRPVSQKQWLLRVTALLSSISRHPAGDSMNIKGQHARKQVEENSPLPPRHAESLPNTSAVLAIAALADRDDIVAAARTAVLLAKSSGASLSVTVLGECVMSLQAGEPAQHGSA